MLNSIRLLLDCLEEANIEYCHWKSNEHLSDSMNGDTDLDMLFRHGQYVQVSEALAKAGLKRFRAMPLMQYNAIEDYIGFDKDTGKIWHLHLHYRLTWGEKHLKGYTTNWGDVILDNRVYDSVFGIYVSRVQDELVLLFCRIALKNRWRDILRDLGGDDLAEMAWLKERCTKSEFMDAACSLLSEKTAKIVFELYECSPVKKHDFARLQKALRIELSHYSGYMAIGSFLTRSRRELFWAIGAVLRRVGIAESARPYRRIMPQGGCVVAFLGCDGAGKSTTIKKVKKEFSKKIDVSCFYLGSGDGSSSLLRLPMRFVAKRVGGRGVGQKMESPGSKKSFKRGLYRLCKIVWAVALAKEKAKKLKRIAKARNKGMLVLCDRYPQAVLSGHGDGPLLDRYREKPGFMGQIAEWERSIYRSSEKNPPDLLVKLMVPTDVAICRKPEMTASEIEQKKSIVQRIDFGGNTVVVWTDCNPEISFVEVMNAVWESI